MRGGVGSSQLNINAVEMVRGIREAHYEEIKALSTQDKITFFRGKARALHAELGLPEGLPPTPARRARARR